MRMGDKYVAFRAIRGVDARAFSGVWVISHEKNDAIREIGDLCRAEGWTLAAWNVAEGLTINGQTMPDVAADPLAAVKAALSLSADGESTSVLVLEDFHHFLQSPEIIATVAQQVLLGKQSRTAIVILSPVLRLPVELEKLFVVVDHALPDRDQLRMIASEIATEEGELPSGTGLEAVLDAASGLTRYEAENAFALSLVRENRLTRETLWEQKSQMLTKAGTLQLYRGDADFSSLGGLDALKAFTRRSLLQRTQDCKLRRPRGVMLLSPPGCGKSEFAKALGCEVGRPVLQLDVGALLGSLVGQSEERTRQTLAIVDRMAPAILMIDEVEKAFSGVGGNGDSGVSARMFGTFLSWLNDHESDVYVVTTSNDVSKLPAEFSRSGRFDGVFVLDLPSREERDAIWRMYLRLFELDEKQKRPCDDQWSGAEIRACCRLAALLDLPIVQASQNVVPVAVSSSQSIDRLRQWADGRCLSANKPGIYRLESKPTKRRRVNREPSNN